MLCRPIPGHAARLSMAPQVAVSARLTMARICAQGPSPKSCTAGPFPGARASATSVASHCTGYTSCSGGGTMRSAGAKPWVVGALSEHSQKCSLCCKGRSQTSTAVCMRRQGGPLGCLVGFTTVQL